MTHVIRAVMKYVRRNPGVAVLVVVAFVALVLAMREPGGTENFRGELSYDDKYRAVRGWCKKYNKTREQARKHYRAKGEGWTKDDISKAAIYAACDEGRKLRRQNNSLGTNDTGLSNTQFNTVFKDCRDNRLASDLETVVSYYSTSPNNYNNPNGVRAACNQGFAAGKKMYDARNWTPEDYKNKCQTGGDSLNVSPGSKCTVPSLRRNYPCQAQPDNSIIGNAWGRCCEKDGKSENCRQQTGGSKTQSQDTIAWVIENAGFTQDTIPNGSGSSNTGKTLKDLGAGDDETCKFYTKSKLAKQVNGKDIWRCAYNYQVEDIDEYNRKVWGSDTNSEIRNKFWDAQCVNRKSSSSNGTNCHTLINNAIANFQAS